MPEFIIDVTTRANLAGGPAFGDLYDASPLSSANERELQVGPVPKFPALPPSPYLTIVDIEVTHWILVSVLVATRPSKVLMLKGLANFVLWLCVRHVCVRNAIRTAILK